MFHQQKLSNSLALDGWVVAFGTARTLMVCKSIWSSLLWNKFSEKYNIVGRLISKFAAVFLAFINADGRQSQVIYFARLRQKNRSMANASICRVISSTTTTPRRVQFPIVTSSIDFRPLRRRRPPTSFAIVVVVWNRIRQLVRCALSSDSAKFKNSRLTD